VKSGFINLIQKQNDTAWNGITKTAKEKGADNNALSP
jgi:hypothetical protein